jgi:Fe-S-cluster containining protein
MKNHYKILNDYLLELQKVKSLDDLDLFLKNISESAYEVYPCISCRNGCYTCCTGPSFPPVYSKEWQRIRNYINSNLSPEKKETIINRINNLSLEKQEALKFVESIVQKNTGISELKQKVNDLINIFKDDVCPLHINGFCSIYEVRPAKCRAFGNFSFAFNTNTQFLSCASDTEKMYNFLKEKKTKQLALPYWNSVEIKLEKIAKTRDDSFEVNIIPLWLKSDISNNIIK